MLRYARAASGRQKVLVFDGCYHGTVDETMVRLRDGRTVARGGQIGAPFDLAAYTVAVPFNDSAALEQALAPRDVACVLAEPVMTNVGTVLPDPGFHAALRRHILALKRPSSVPAGPASWRAPWALRPRACSSPSRARNAASSAAR